MDNTILMAMRRPWPQMIFSGQKPFEFRNHLGREWGPGTEVIIYESKTNGGRGMVVGEAAIERIHDFSERHIGPPRPLFRYWAEYINQDPEVRRLADKLGDYELPKYADGSVYRYLVDEQALDKVLMTGEWLNLTKPVVPHCMEGCERWLEKIGLVYAGRYWYNYALKLKAVREYQTPRPITDYGFARPPQSWVYLK